MTTTIPCRTCAEVKGESAFTKDGLRRRQCRGCTKVRLQRGRRGTLARRLYFNLMQHMRKKGWVESSCWCLRDVELLLQASPVKSAEGTVRIARVDEKRPWVVENSKVVVV